MDEKGAKLVSEAAKVSHETKRAGEGVKRERERFDRSADLTQSGFAEARRRLDEMIGAMRRQ